MRILATWSFIKLHWLFFQNILSLFHWIVSLAVSSIHWSFIPSVSVQFSLVALSCLTLRPHGLCMPGLPVHHQLLEFIQTHIHWVSDAIQPSHPLSSPSPPAFNLSQHQGPFRWISSSHQVAKVLEFQPQHLSFQWIFRTNVHLLMFLPTNSMICVISGFFLMGFFFLASL